jgi:hypothetical protein
MHPDDMMDLESRNRLRKAAINLLRVAAADNDEVLQPNAALVKAYRSEVDRNGGEPARMFGDGRPMHDTLVLAWAVAEQALVRADGDLPLAADHIEQDRGLASDE